MGVFLFIPKSKFKIRNPLPLGLKPKAVDTEFLGLKPQAVNTEFLGLKPQAVNTENLRLSLKV
jgi:hypothetical protein